MRESDSSTKAKRTAIHQQAQIGYQEFPTWKDESPGGCSGKCYRTLKDCVTPTVQHTPGRWRRENTDTCRGGCSRSLCILDQNPQQTKSTFYLVENAYVSSTAKMTFSARIVDSFL